MQSAVLKDVHQTPQTRNKNCPLLTSPRSMERTFLDSVLQRPLQAAITSNIFCNNHEKYQSIIHKFTWIYQTLFVRMIIIRTNNDHEILNNHVHTLRYAQVYKPQKGTSFGFSCVRKELETRLQNFDLMVNIAKGIFFFFFWIEQAKDWIDSPCIKLLQTEWPYTYLTCKT